MPRPVRLQVRWPHSPTNGHLLLSKQARIHQSPQSSELPESVNSFSFPGAVGRAADCVFGHQPSEGAVPAANRRSEPSMR